MSKNVYKAVNVLNRGRAKEILPGTLFTVGEKISAKDVKDFLSLGAIAEASAEEAALFEKTNKPATKTDEVKEMTVAEVKAATEGADLATLEAMLQTENGRDKPRGGAVKAIEDAIGALSEGDSDDDDAGETADGDIVG